MPANSILPVSESRWMRNLRGPNTTTASKAVYSGPSSRLITSSRVAFGGASM